MTALDKAFVKAYGKVAQGGRSADEQFSAPTMRTLDEIALRSPVREFLPIKFTPSPEILYRPEWISPSQASSVVPAPHIDFRLVSLPPRSETPIASRIDPPHVVAAAPLRAAFEVETFVWPEVARKLGDLQDAAFAPLLAELGELSGRGQKLIAISGCRAGAGATSLLLALAQKLGKREVSTAVVDLEFWRPQLARQMGIAPQAGWWDVLRGELPLTEALVESLQDRVTLMPLREAVAASELPDATQLADLLRTLSRDFDLVLLNVGPLQADPTDPSATVDVAAWLGNLQVDLALLVRDTRKTGYEESLAIGRRLTSAGVKQWHLAENYTSIDEPVAESARPVAPVTPSRVASVSAYSTPVYSAPIVSPVTTTSLARPAAVASASKTNDSAPADWQSTVVPPWKI